MLIHVSPLATACTAPSKCGCKLTSYPGQIALHDTVQVRHLNIVPNAGQYNDLATLFLANPDQTIKHLFSLGALSRQQQVCSGDNCYFTLRSLVLLGPVYLCLMSMAASLAIPGGLFMPSIIVRPLLFSRQSSFILFVCCACAALIASILLVADNEQCLSRPG